jgi:hypothetical protein
MRRRPLRWRCLSAVALLAAGAVIAAPGPDPTISPAPAGPGTVFKEWTPFLRAATPAWTFAVDRRDDATLRAVLVWSDGSRRATGTLAGAENAYYPEHYSGSLGIDGSAHALRVAASEKPCVDAAGVAHELEVTIRIEGLADLATGCGDFKLPDPP